MEDLKKQLAAAQQAAQEARARQRDAKGKLDSTKSDLSTLEHDISSRVCTPFFSLTAAATACYEKQQAWLLCALDCGKMHGHYRLTPLLGLVRLRQVVVVIFAKTTCRCRALAI